MSTSTISTKRVKLGVFAERYWDDESRPCHPTLISHIKRGWLSGKKIGTHWYVECTTWGAPLFYSSEIPKVKLDNPPKTGNALADKILAEI